MTFMKNKCYLTFACDMAISVDSIETTACMVLIDQIIL